MEAAFFPCAYFFLPLKSCSKWNLKASPCVSRYMLNTFQFFLLSTVRQRVLRAEKPFEICMRTPVSKKTKNRFEFRLFLLYLDLLWSDNTYNPSIWNPNRCRQDNLSTVRESLCYFVQKPIVHWSMLSSSFEWAHTEQLQTCSFTQFLKCCDIFLAFLRPFIELLWYFPSKIHGILSLDSLCWKIAHMLRQNIVKMQRNSHLSPIALNINVEWKSTSEQAHS